MKITKIYCESALLEDSSKDKVNITMSREEFISLINCLDLARFNLIKKEEVINLYRKLDDANTKRKVKWVK